MKAEADHLALIWPAASPRRRRRHGFVDEADDFIEDGRATIEMRKLF
jgi:hypothetical protein